MLSVEKNVDAISNTTHLTDAERLDPLRLIRSDNVGPRTFQSLLHHFGDAGRRWSGCPIWRGGVARPGRDASVRSRMRKPNSPQQPE